MIDLLNYVLYNFLLMWAVIVALQPQPWNYNNFKSIHIIVKLQWTWNSEFVVKTNTVFEKSNPWFRKKM